MIQVCAGVMIQWLWVDPIIVGVMIQWLWGDPIIVGFGINGCEVIQSLWGYDPMVVFIFMHVKNACIKSPCPLNSQGRGGGEGVEG